MRRLAVEKARVSLDSSGWPVWTARLDGPSRRIVCRGLNEKVTKRENQ